MSTHIDGTPGSISGHPQFEDEIVVGVYQRTALDVDSVGFSFYKNVPDGGVTWDGRRLKIQMPGTFPPKVNIDLSWDEKSKAWHGLFERGAFQAQVTLKRPSDTLNSPFVGTWFNSREVMNNCLHIAQQTDGGLTAWSDDLQLTPGLVVYANGVHRPSQTFENYGEIAKAKIDPTSSSRITIWLRANTPVCCSHPFTASLSAGGHSMTGDWLDGGNQLRRAVEWRRMPGDSCNPFRALDKP